MHTDTPQPARHMTRADILTAPIGAILRAPDAEDVTVVESTTALLLVLVSGQLWSWRPASLLVLAGLGYVQVGTEDAEVLAERVALARADYRARRAA